MKHVIVILLILGCLLGVSCNRLSHGKKIKFESFDVYYGKGATKEDAQKLGEYFVGLGLNEASSERKSMQVQKSGVNYVVKFILIDDAEIDPQKVESFEFIGYMLSALVFNEKPVDIHLCGDGFQTRKELRFAEYSVKLDELFERPAQESDIE